MSNDSDKTVFQRPQPAGDRTVMKPSGGARRPAPRQAGNPRQAARPNLAQPRAGIENESGFFTNQMGLNPLANAASTLIAVFGKTRQTVSHNDVGGLHRSLVGEIKTFDAKLRELGYKNEIVLSARYMVCVMLDEAVLNTPWGSNSPWAQRTLLSVFHNETSGGEKFFQILDRMRQSPSENIDMLELFYICLSLGYEGKYRIVNRGRDQLEQLREDLFKLIRSQRGEYSRELAQSWQGLGNAKRTLTDFIPMWVIGVVALAIVFFSYSGFRYWLYESSTPVAQTLQTIAKEPDTQDAQPNRN